MIRPYLYYAFKIKDGLYIGNKRAANDIQFQFYNQITLIINCAALEMRINNQMVDVINFEWLDKEEQQIVVKTNIDQVYNAIEETNERGESVLICCISGQSRSVTIAAAYFMKKLNWNLKTSLQYLQICRKDFEIREGFLYQLSRYERELLTMQKGDLTEQDKQGKELEILLKNTYFNAKLFEFWESSKTHSFSKRKPKKCLKKVYWAQKLVTFINNSIDSIQQNILLIQKNDYFDMKKLKQLNIMKQNGDIEKKQNQYSFSSRNKTPDPIRNRSIQFDNKYRNKSVIKQIESESNQFLSQRKSLTKGEKQIRVSKCMMQFRMK
ncbi:unnamed protein product [Paramecium sonneborni]|uniref:Tyrosine-protein phosphatase domain-containing protein n=1 Tax=Paramecium sonneborni TaxID=65129 RepID=A0A8S1M1U1_9CILI|nr:unnamed protein product [Paramecium sonneborni]